MEKRRFILDTDIGPDCDDCGALAILDRACADGKAELLGVTHCTSDLLSVDVIAAINDWFGVVTPIGQTERTGFFDDVTKYTKPVSEAYRAKLAGTDKKAPETERPVPLLRRLLAANTGITFVLIGPLGNLADLLTSGPDEISPLDGVSLMKKSVDKVVIMGGDFKDTDRPEFNIKCDIPASKTVVKKCPAPIVWCGFEAGLDVITGETLKDCPADYPVRLAYEKYTDESFRRPSWDLATVLYALTPDSEDWIVSDECRVDFADDGAVMISEGKGSRWVRHRDERALEKTLNGIIGLSD